MIENKKISIPNVSNALLQKESFNAAFVYTLLWHPSLGVFQCPVAHTLGNTGRVFFFMAIHLQRENLQHFDQKLGQFFKIKFV